MDKIWTKRKKIWYAMYLMFAAKLPVSRRSGFARKLRNCLARKVCSADKSSNIEKNANFNPTVTVGKNSSIGIKCDLDGPITIGDNVMMGPDVAIYTRNHKRDSIDIPMIEQGYTDFNPVTIEDDVWIGRRVIILPGVTIAKGCIIGAGAVVTKSTVPYSVWGGVPARLISSRNNNEPLDGENF